MNMNTKRKLKLIERTQVWLLVQLYQSGISVNQTELNTILNGKLQTPKAKKVLEATETILAGEKNRIIREIEEAFA